MAKARALYAEFLQALVFVDGPQVVLLKMPGKSFIVGVAVDRVRGDISFIGGRIGEKMLDEYLRNRCDLRYVIGYPDYNKHYTFDLPTEGSKVLLATYDFSPERDEDLLPEHRFFASDHTEDCDLLGSGFNATQRFEVDGKWEVQEFSKFNRNYSDIYALSRSVERFEDSQVPIDERRRIKDSFVKPWRGGGSYLSFFTEITRSGGRSSKPVVDAIQWASPGHMDFLGDSQSFDRVNRILRNYDTKKFRIDRAYDQLWKFLSDNKLLKTGRRNFDKRSGIALEVNNRAKSFSKELGISSYRVLKKMTDNDPLIAAKVLLASARRLSKMHDFFLQGRVSLDNEDIG